MSKKDKLKKFVVPVFIKVEEENYANAMCLAEYVVACGKSCGTMDIPYPPPALNYVEYSLYPEELYA